MLKKTEAATLKFSVERYSLWVHNFLKKSFITNAALSLLQKWAAWQLCYLRAYSNRRNTSSEPNITPLQTSKSL